MGRFHRHDGTEDHDHQYPHDHSHTHEHEHDHSHVDPALIGDHSGYGTSRQRVEILEDIFAENDHLAAHNRAAFDAAGVRAINLMSSPGAGKTELLQRTLAALQGRLRVGVIEGDIETPLDAERLAGLGAQVSLLNTGAGFGGECHLDAPMVARALAGLDLGELDVVLIENVGNLVCPAEFDVGEHHKAMVFSITEGEDKPLKYPVMFRSVEAVVINKMDLAPHLDFDLELFLRNLRQVNPTVTTFELSARTGEGVAAWVEWVAGVRPATDPPYRDPSLPIGERVADLLARLTIEEKVGQVSQYFYFGAFAPEAGEHDTSADALPLDADMFREQPKLVEAALARGAVGSLLFVKDAASANRLQRLAIEGNRHGIPLLFGFDVIHGFRTIFPVPIAQAASWDPAGVEAGQQVAAREARAAGIHWAFAPMVDIARDPRWGRIVEGAGEDPVLGGAMAAAQVRGFQGDLGPDNILAGPKHLAGYGAALGGRDYDDADISDSELWNLYLPPFKAAVDAGAANIMGAYMDLNGVPASANRWLLTDVLRTEFGFDGFVVSDANAVRSLETQHFARDLTDAAARAIDAGLDMEMSMVDPAYSRLPQAVEQGLVSAEAVDEAVRRVLAVKFRLGLFENPWADEESSETTLREPGHRDLARAAAERSFVLLKNDPVGSSDPVLPLAPDALGSVAVIGQLAASRRDTVGPWVFDQDNTETVTILEGLQARLGERVRVGYADGASVPARSFPSMFDRMDSLVTNTPDDYDDDRAIAAAVELAARSDVAIVVAGQRQNQIGENASSGTLDLPGRQLEQLQRIVATGTPVVLVVMSGRPLDLRWADAHVPAILQVWYPGTRGGEAVASALVGDVSPAGRLPFTWPRHVGQVPMVYNHYRTFQPEHQDKRYWEEESTPLYPFGHGLSYATFVYTNLRVDRDTVPVGEAASVSVDVTNSSDRAAEEVAQLYIHQRYGTSTRPVRELKGFQRVSLAPRETRTLTFTLGPDELRYWSAVTRDWVQDATTLDLWIGGSSRSDLTTTLTVS